MKCLAVAVLLVGMALGVQAQVFQCSTADGKVMLTDKPCRQGQESKVALEKPESAVQARSAAAEADAQRIRAQQEESARKAEERARMAQQPRQQLRQQSSRSSAAASQKNVEACMQWQRKLKMQENLVRPDPQAVKNAKSQVRRYC